MAKKKILSVGIELASDDIDFAPYDSDMSLLDWDVILFKPNINDFLDYSATYQGKPSLSDSRSFRLRERSEHWRKEIELAFETGKTVFCFLTDYLQLYIDTGERTYSGTGRNQKVTRIVALYDNYRCFPVDLNPVSTRGTSMKLIGVGIDVLSTYWHEFEQYSEYKVVIDSKKIPAAVYTKKGDRKVGSIVRSNDSPGVIVLLPDIDFYSKNFLVKKTKDYAWTDAAIQFASRFVTTLVQIDKVIKSTDETTPEPDWVKDISLETEEEKKQKALLLKVEMMIEDLSKKKSEIQKRINASGKLRNLLFEKGNPLEHSIRSALTILGFVAEQYRNTESEFDVVFIAKEGRFLGEAEGKDNKAINIDKLRQLEMNIHEDLSRDGVEVPAKAVLFGNPFRLQPPDERPDPFTPKCLNASTRSSTALVHTPDLFQVVFYLSNHRDMRFATKCRKALFKTVGRVSFPAIPALNSSDVTVSNETRT